MAILLELERKQTSHFQAAGKGDRWSLFDYLADENAALSTVEPISPLTLTSILFFSCRIQYAIRPH